MHHAEAADQAEIVAQKNSKACCPLRPKGKTNAPTDLTTCTLPQLQCYQYRSRRPAATFSTERTRIKPPLQLLLPASVAGLACRK